MSLTGIGKVEEVWVGGGIHGEMPSGHSRDRTGLWQKIQMLPAKPSENSENGVL